MYAAAYVPDTTMSRALSNGGRKQIQNRRAIEHAEQEQDASPGRPLVWLPWLGRSERTYSARQAGSLEMS